MKVVITYPDEVHDDLTLNGFPPAPPLPRKWRRIWQEFVAIGNQPVAFAVRHYNATPIGDDLAYFVEEGTAIVFKVEEPSLVLPKRRIVLLACGASNGDLPRADVIRMAKQRLRRI